MTQPTGKCEKCGKPLSDPNATLCDRCQMQETEQKKIVIKVIGVLITIIGIIGKVKFGQKK